MFPTGRWPMPPASFLIAQAFVAVRSSRDHKMSATSKLGPGSAFRLRSFVSVHHGQCGTMCPGRLLGFQIRKRGSMRIHPAGYLMLSILVLGATAAGAPPSQHQPQDQPQSQDQDQPPDQAAFQNFSADEL